MSKMEYSQLSLQKILEFSFTSFLFLKFCLCVYVCVCVCVNFNISTNNIISVEAAKVLWWYIKFPRERKLCFKKRKKIKKITNFFFSYTILNYEVRCLGLV
jgi:hypothetical protein